MVVKIEKCNKSKGTCQRLKNFKLDNICQLFEMKNVFWYPLIKAIYPQPKCPVIQKVNRPDIKIGTTINKYFTF